MDFGKILQHLRTEQGIFQKQSASELHVSTDYLLGRTQYISFSER